MNDDLIGYEMVVPGDPPATWVVIGSSPVCGDGYVILHRKGTDGTNHYDTRIQTAPSIRRRMAIEAEAAGQLTLDAA